jgi:hypothetical protein
MQPYHGLGLHDNEDVGPTRPKAAEYGPEESVQSLSEELGTREPGQGRGVRKGSPHPERTQAGRLRYKQGFDAGKVGKTVYSRSGKNMPIGRPKRIFNRDRVAE